MYTAQQGLLQLKYAIVDAITMLWSTFLALLTRGTANSLAASVIWVTGLWTTATFLTELEVVGPTFLYAILLQAILTNGQGPIWHPAQRQHRRGAFIIGIACLIVDIGLNIGGLWIYLSNLGETTLWAAVSAAANNPSPPTALTCFMITVGVAMIVALGPEALWDL